MAQESDASPLTADVLPEGWELLPLPGHFLDMVGFRTPDDVVYLADCLASRETLDKYGIAFLYDVSAYLATLERSRPCPPPCSSPPMRRPRRTSRR